MMMAPVDLSYCKRRSNPCLGISTEKKETKRLSVSVAEIYTKNNEYQDDYDWDYICQLNDYRVHCLEGTVMMKTKSSCFFYTNFSKFYQKVEKSRCKFSLCEIAKIANVFFQDSKFRLIEKVEEFCNKFKSKCHEAEESKCDQYQYARMLSYKDVDLSKLHDPTIENEQLIFYVEQSGLPYKVTASLKTNEAQYEVLENLEI